MATLKTMTEVCEQLCSSRNTVYELMRAGKLKSLKIGRSLRFRQEDIDSYVFDLVGAAQ